MLFTFFCNFLVIGTNSLELTVAQDGSGDYTSIGSALKAFPTNSPNPSRLFVKKGVYKEKLVIPR